jgi:alkanesulfonate monooxygenase SsuD/methylene tetrahydromethanopterin reductase-like flavin-dependent oxidoreductase (luciferase family)
MRFGLFCSPKADSGNLGPETGRGFRDYLDFNIEAEARFEEAIELITRSWTTRARFSHHGSFWNFNDIVVEPPSAQNPRPPFWVAAGNPHSIARAAARGFNLILDQYASPQTLAERIAIFKAEREAKDLEFNPMQVTVARQLYVAKDKADKEAVLVKQAEYTKRTINVSRALDAKSGSHVLAYADKAGATEENALFGTPDEICGMLEALRGAGVEYVLLTISGWQDQLRRFAREIMPIFARESTACAVEWSADNDRYSQAP